MKTDMTPRYAPTEVMSIKHGIVPVRTWKIHPPETHFWSPLVNDMTALECVTEHGSRWYGIERGYINSELRMVIEGTNPRDEVRMKWEECHAQ